MKINNNFLILIAWDSLVTFRKCSKAFRTNLGEQLRSFSGVCYYQEVNSGSSVCTAIHLRVDNLGKNFF